MARIVATTPTDRWGGAFWADLGERVGRVFVYSLITLVSMDNILEGPDWDTTLWPVLVLPVLLSALTGVLANFKDPASGASLLNSPPGPLLTEEPPRRAEDGAGEGRLIVLIMVGVLAALVLWTILTRL